MATLEGTLLYGDPKTGRLYAQDTNPETGEKLLLTNYNAAVRTSTWAPRTHTADEPAVATQRTVATASATQLIKLNNEIERLEGELEEANARIRERPVMKEPDYTPYNRRIEYLEKELKEEQQQHSDDLERLEKELLDNNDEWKAARERDSNRFDEMEKKVDDLQELIDDLQDQRDKHLKGQKIAEAQVKTLTEQLGDLGLRADRTDTSALTAQLNQLIATNRKSEDSVQQNIEEYQDKISAQRDNWDAKQEAETAEMKQRIDELQAEREKENMEFEAEFVAMNKRLEELQLQRQQDADEFQAEYTQLDDKYAQSRIDLTDARSNWEKAMEDGRMTADELSGLRLEYEAMREKLREIEAAKEAADEEVTATKSNWDKALEDGRLTMEELDALREEYEAMRQELAEIAAARELAAKEADEHKTNWERAMADGEITAAELEQLKKEYDDMKRQLSQVNAQHDTAVGEIMSIKSNWDKFAVDGQVTKQQLQQLSAEYEQMHRHLLEVNQMREHAMGQARDHKNHLDRFVQENADLKREIQRLSSEHDNARHQIQDYAAQGQATARAINDLKANADRVTNENRLAQQQLQQIQAQYDNMRQQQLAAATTVPAPMQNRQVLVQQPYQMMVNQRAMSPAMPPQQKYAPVIQSPKRPV